MYAKMSDSEKKQFFQSIIKSIEINPEAKSKTRVLKHIEFKFPVGYDAEEGQILLRTRNDVETVCLLSKLSEAKNHISVQVDMDEMDLTAVESKATCQEIQDWVKEKYGFHVSHLNIAKTRRKCGIIERGFIICRKVRTVAHQRRQRRRKRRLSRLSDTFV